jgi:hypothetical protein
MVVRAPPHGERNSAAGVRTAPADRRSSAKPVEWIGLWRGRSTAGGLDHHHADCSGNYDDCGGAVANSATADYRRRGGSRSIGNCGAEGFLGCSRLDNIYADAADHILDRRHIGRRVDNPSVNNERGTCGRARCRDIIGVGDHVDDPAWNGGSQ